MRFIETLVVDTKVAAPHICAANMGFNLRHSSANTYCLGLICLVMNLVILQLKMKWQ